MKKKSHPLGAKTLTRIITVFVFLLSGAMVSYTVWFFASTLSNVAARRGTGESAAPKPVGIDPTLLDGLLKFHEERTQSAPIDTSMHSNPFVLPPEFDLPPATSANAPVVDTLPTPGSTVPTSTETPRATPGSTASTTQPVNAPGHEPPPPGPGDALGGPGQPPLPQPEE